MGSMLLFEICSWETVGLFWRYYQDKSSSFTFLLTHLQATYECMIGQENFCPTSQISNGVSLQIISML